VSIIKIQQLNFDYGGDKVIKNISFEIETSKLVAIIGANGSGKSTLLRNMSGYLKPRSGTISVCGKKLEELSIKERARYIGYLPQDNNVDFDFNCLDIVMMGRMPYLKRFQRENSDDRQVVKESMDLTNTWHFRDKSITNLSGGERQRVFISRALAQSPKILLMDEPITYLDIKYQLEILMLLKQLCSKGILSIAVLHDINLALQFCDEIIMIHWGEIIAKGEPRAVITSNNIKVAFDVDVEVLQNPVSGKPYVVPKVTL
jgi:iron complex transport system ATP-binding protein